LMSFQNPSRRYIQCDVHASMHWCVWRIGASIMPSEKKKKDADIPLKKTGVVGPFRSRRNTEH